MIYFFLHQMSLTKACPLQITLRYLLYIHLIEKSLLLDGKKGRICID